MVEEITMYKCPLCMQVYSDRSEAEACEAGHHRTVRIAGADYSADSATGYPDSVGIEFAKGKVLRYDYADGKWWQPKEAADVLRAVEAVEQVEQVEQMEQDDRIIELASGPDAKHCGDCENFLAECSVCDYDNETVSKDRDACNFFKALKKKKAYCKDCKYFKKGCGFCEYDGRPTRSDGYTWSCAQFEHK